MKLKVAFLSADSFVDVDIPILLFLKDQVDITWYVVLNTEPRFTEEYLVHFAHENNIKLKTIPLKKRRRSLVNLKSYWQLFRELYDSSFDVVYIEYIKDPYSYLLSLFIPKSKKILGAHDIVPHSSMKSLSDRLLHDGVLSSFRYVQSFSQTQRDQLKLLTHKDNSFVIPLSKKNPGVVSSARPSIEDGLRLLFFGGIHSYKRLDILIDALEMLVQESDVDIKLTIAGKGSDWENVQYRIRTKSLYNLKIGFIFSDDIPNLFNSHHFIVLPYQDVTQSGPLFDAFNYELPAIVSDQLGFLEFVKNGETGFVFETNSVHELKSVLLNVARLNRDDYQRIRNELSIYTEKFNPNHIARLYLKMFYEVAGKRRKDKLRLVEQYSFDKSL